MAISIQEAAKVAKARTSDKRWQNAIDKAVAGVQSGQWIVTEFAHCVAVTTESEKIYRGRRFRSCRGDSRWHLGVGQK